MYMNIYQRCMKMLLSEFGPLYQRQLETLVRRKVNGRFQNLDGYIGQMCQFGDYEKIRLGDEILVSPTKTPPDNDMLRSIDVVLGFMDGLLDVYLGNEPVKLRFFVKTGEREKELCVIPVHPGKERIISGYVCQTGGETVILLLDDKEQIGYINTLRPCKFVTVIGRNVTFYTKN